MQKELWARDRHFDAEAKMIIQRYQDGESLTDSQSNALYICAIEHCQILDNVVHTKWFEGALTEHLESGR